jgi:hypothetical protein
MTDWHAHGLVMRLNVWRFLGAVLIVVALWTEGLASGDRNLPAERCTVVRKDGEPHAVFWQRVVNTVRGLKFGRAFDHTVVLFIFHEGDPLPGARECMQDDANFNVKRTLWHTANYSRDARMRIGALCMLADLSAAPVRAKH